VAAVKILSVHIVSAVISKIFHCGCHEVMITFIRAIRSAFLGVVPASLIGCVVGIARLCAVAATVRVRSQVDAISFVVCHNIAV
jgi:ABC-type amino acid transport system permease subunit